MVRHNREQRRSTAPGSGRKASFSPGCTPGENDNRGNQQAPAIPQVWEANRHAVQMLLIHAATADCITAGSKYTKLRHATRGAEFTITSRSLRCGSLSQPTDGLLRLAPDLFWRFPDTLQASMPGATPAPAALPEVRRRAWWSSAMARRFAVRRIPFPSSSLPARPYRRAGCPLPSIHDQLPGSRDR